ncbi:TetR/AcrR family transcriptional regulator [Sneathia vaginalis]|uniref:HTH tetR-type domain-containing protein n=1 Tax=Sneathia vaginalis TaxID=187101 RepID=A0A0E3ZBT3_9FUSO|nr:MULTISPECIES: TetR/AcrR family transcriptional regulator [Sneathia]AKC95706.1 hypothetical protein VC03_04220 [Sneathia vaginalis]MBE3031534.1 helix-turn-helix transcriptional regulator [Sneathia sp. DSM 16631]
MNCKFSKDKILKVAKKEFLKKGYKGVSMRHIAKLCKLTTGAIYGNFKNKEDMFNQIILVDMPKIHEVFEIAKSKSLACNKKVVDILKKGIITEEVMDEAMNMYKIMFEYKDSFILLYSSQGTEYEKIVNTFTEEDIKSTIDLYKKVKGVVKIEKYIERILRLIARECFSGAIPFLIDYENYEKAKPYLRLYFKYYLTSFLFLVNYKENLTK